MAGAYAEMMMDMPNRPTCCLVHEAGFIQNMLKGVALHYSRVRNEREAKRGGTDGTS